MGTCGVPAGIRYRNSTQYVRVHWNEYRLVNSTWVFSGDYLAVKNITLGYTFS